MQASRGTDGVGRPTWIQPIYLTGFFCVPRRRRDGVFFLRFISEYQKEVKLAFQSYREAASWHAFIEA